MGKIQRDGAGNTGGKVRPADCSAFKLDLRFADGTAEDFLVANSDGNRVDFRRERTDRQHDRADQLPFLEAGKREIIAQRGGKIEPEHALAGRRDLDHRVFQQEVRAVRDGRRCARGRQRAFAQRADQSRGIVAAVKRHRSQFRHQAVSGGRREVQRRRALNGPGLGFDKVFALGADLRIGRSDGGIHLRLNAGGKSGYGDGAAVDQNVHALDALDGQQRISDGGEHHHVLLLALDVERVERQVDGRNAAGVFDAEKLRPRRNDVHPVGRRSRAKERVDRLLTDVLSFGDGDAPGHGRKRRSICGDVIERHADGRHVHGLAENHGRWLLRRFRQDDLRLRLRRIGRADAPCQRKADRRGERRGERALKGHRTAPF